MKNYLGYRSSIIFIGLLSVFLTGCPPTNGGYYGGYPPPSQGYHYDQGYHDRDDYYYRRQQEERWREERERERRREEAERWRDEQRRRNEARPAPAPAPAPQRPAENIVRPSCPPNTTFDGKHCIVPKDQRRPGGKGTVSACPSGMWVSGDRCVK